MSGITQDSFWSERAARWRAAAGNPLLRSRIFFSVFTGKIADRQGFKILNKRQFMRERGEGADRDVVDKGIALARFCYHL